jgi:hypothetical protein
MQTTDNYDDILQEARHNQEGIGGAWRVIAVMAIVLVSVSSLLHLV